MAKQIVSIAQSKYAGHVSIAVRDAEGRRTLELYAQGDGAENAAVGNDSARREPVQDGRLGRGNVPGAGQPERGSGDGPDVRLAEHRRGGCGELHDRPVRDAGIRLQPDDGGAELERRPDAAVGQHAGSRIGCVLTLDFAGA